MTSNDLHITDDDIKYSDAIPLYKAQQDSNATITAISSEPTYTKHEQQFIPHRPVGPDSSEMNCPHCRCRISTKVRHNSTIRTYAMCLALSWTCCICCLPFCMDACRNANHYCPMCNGFIGTYQN